MIKKQLLERSPLRILEKTTHGGPGKGNLGAVVARKGVGKTAILVHLATYHLLNGKNVIHVSFSARTDHIVDWYEQIFSGIAKRYDLEDALNIHQELIRQRVIMNFNQAGVSVDSITRSLSAMIGAGHFPADLVMVDGYDFSRAGVEEIDTFREFSRNMNVETWFSVTAPPDVPPEEAPVASGAYRDLFAVVTILSPKEDYVALRIIKDHDETPPPDTCLKLDPGLLLITG